jgi:hypothetical protein
MTCEGARADYVATIEDLTRAARLMAQHGEVYLAEIRSTPRYRHSRQRRVLRDVAAMLQRLAAEERRMLEHYRDDTGVHEAIPEAQPVPDL